METIVFFTKEKKRINIHVNLLNIDFLKGESNLDHR